MLVMKNEKKKIVWESAGWDGECGMVPKSDSECGVVPESDSECGTVPDNDSECGVVPESDSECGVVLDGASKHGMYSMGTIINYDLSDVTMTNYGKFPEFTDVWMMYDEENLPFRGCVLIQ